ncbi:MAG: transcription-repair coupling factor, partial [Clostridia bacterium]|nr:transcription-repair coupling factor [Clostridia bacterium]
SQGIGRYLGVERLKVGENARDYLLIQYAGTDKLYLPVDQLDLLQKYIGSEGKAPKLYKLGGSEWQRVKARVRASVRDMAKELLALYAAREAAEGYAFSPDTPWQREFEDRFIYEETPDQLRAIEEIKADMENSKPMDRLLCGDVGYGKTEVAMRAAFKAVSDGKQVALLAPTTVLAQQHFRTFSERFADYPVSIAVLGRFTSSREQKSIVEKMAKGEIDLLIGTHRILSKDVKFKDLGLLIVDEEQRFGVAHKEKIKTLKTNIDVLVLSATPIPRTLHMALAGMRDMSVIETPPAERRPVQTYVLEYFDRLIKDAVQRELSRGGQVYFVHNKIMSIDRLADDLAELIPQARIAVAHGRMPEGELERVMSEFVEGKHNLLVCTTIIESGLDIPNVNTLIVNEADKFGLAQLYQLRGRVGRSERQAYAYFTYRPNHIINETAKKRLLAIRDFTELGAGFKIAMRDLEIRGAGDILGAQQHGHIAAVGFDLYCRLLREEIERGVDESKPVVEEVNTQLDLDINAYIPDSYLADGNLKIEIYKRIAAARSLSELDELRAELLDRYGRIPAALNNLLLLGGLKTYTRALGIAAVSRKGSQIIMRLAQGRELKPESLMGLLAEYPGQICFRQKQDFLIIITVGDLKEREVIDSLMNILSRLSELNAL